ncbi:MAG: neutral/alkaline non-lysosomal ceramidase N-terminal domain-containing protein, partial [Candidatus Nealsonbacteria bacterium]|nr:neutral/alkaline non-lysosomal ceramidase N-terminal domain-containing protein [Candidatus Nealsonbacteria bacterium]
MKRTGLLCIIGLVVLWSSLAPAAEWRAGIARTDITPGEPLWMAGYAARKHPAEGSIHPLWAKALVLEDQRALEDQQGGRVVIVTADAIGFTRKMFDAITARAHARTGISPERILLSASHTHSGPVLGAVAPVVTYGLDKQQLAAVAAHVRELEDKLVELIEEACKDMVPVTLAYAEGEATFGGNRRKSINPDGPVDHRVPVLRISDESGRLLAVLFGYACHNTTLGSDLYQYNGDYAGFAQIALEAAHPEAMAMFVTGCGGDINPYPRGKLELAQQHGKSLAAAVDRALAKDLHPVKGPLAVAFARVDLPFVDPPTKEELEERRGKGNVYDQRLTELLLNRIAEHGSLEAAYPCPVQVVRFGDDLSLIALSGEVVVDYALLLRKRFEGQRIWVAGYCNEVFGYLPSERVLAEGGYEGGVAMK